VVGQRGADTAIQKLANSHADGSAIWHVPFHSPRGFTFGDDNPFPYNNRFSLRFYLPRKRKTSRLFLLINGLSEGVAHVWDRLGATLANAGVASVLVPLPQHYCRNTLFNINDYDPDDSFNLTSGEMLSHYSHTIKHGFLQHPELLVELDKQMMSDIDEIVRSVTLRNAAYYNKLNEFAAQHFAKRLRVSILGFSLGGLVALQSFLNNPRRFNSCILINSGASFQDMNASQVFQNNWRPLQRLILERTRNLSRREMATNFERVFLGHEKVVLHDMLIENKNKLLVLLGGSDPIFNTSNIVNILPRETGLAVFQIPALGHFINISSRGGDIWNEWSSFTARMIVSFDQFRPQDKSGPPI
jgi:hypothetical protein